jgi:hypothetical protein
VYSSDIQAPPTRGLSPPKTQQDFLTSANLLDRETNQLRLQIASKRQELDALNFKHAKAHSKFLEVMRELSRFRDDFADQYSLRSKLVKVRDVTEQIEGLLDIKEYRLDNERQTIQRFEESEKRLVEQTSKDPVRKSIQKTFYIKGGDIRG